MRATDERLARVALNRLGEPGNVNLLSVVHRDGALSTYESLLTEPARSGQGEETARALGSIDPAAELERAQLRGLRFVVPGDAEWPSQLGDLAHVLPIQDRGHVPIGLWVRGPLSLEALTSSVAVVGSRAATTYGARVAADIAARCSLAGLVVVSGAAFGIDQAGHRGALGSGAPTVAVLACGADRVYPGAHTDLLDRIATTGAVVAETAPGLAPLRIRFLARNRLIAALTQGTVLVEAAVRSGALNTANWADRLSRRLMGVPGPVTSGASAGVHVQLRRHAMLVTGGDDVLELLGASGAALAEEPVGPARPRDHLTRRLSDLLEHVPVATPVGSSSIARAAGLPLLRAEQSLRRLLAAGLVTEQAGGWRLSEAALSDL